MSTGLVVSRRLAFTWRQGDWGTSETTDVEIRFEAAGQGARVTVEHGGWDRVPSAGPGLPAGYSHGWAELLGFHAEKAGAR
ncbi:SRPBCC domain-containing protein [Streptomyces sp. NPDC002659]|uniref:SRPBCC domain-containing protein n=1 Tax=Streptomyces sp. NPDC002659 TaxID=3364656 RepID=UPI0036B552E5